MSETGMITSSYGNIFHITGPFVRGIHRSSVDSPHKGRWRGAMMFSLVCAWTNGWASNRDPGDFRRHSAHYDVTVMDNFYVTHLLTSICPISLLGFPWVLWHWEVFTFTIPSLWFILKGQGQTWYFMRATYHIASLISTRIFKAYI